MNQVIVWSAVKVDKKPGYANLKEKEEYWNAEAEDT